jgi:hypothetical protein
MNYEEWIDYLRWRGELSLERRQELVHLLRSERPSVRAHVLTFCNRMADEHPDLWIAYRTTKRILRGVKL